MAPYEFDALDTDAILRSSDGEEFRVHRLILSLSSPVFQGMFGLPQPTADPLSQIPTINLSDPSDVLKPFIQYLCPRSPPEVADISMWAALYTIADKYNAEVVMDPLRDMLVPRFLEAYPLRVYAFASRWGFEEEARIASRRTLTMDILKSFPQETRNSWMASHVDVFYSFISIAEKRPELWWKSTLFRLQVTGPVRAPLQIIAALSRHCVGVWLPNRRRAV